VYWFNDGIKESDSTPAGRDDPDKYLTDNVEGAGLIENAIGGGYDDVLIGNAADNILTGNGGADTFVLNSLTGVDTITDYDGVGDKIKFDSSVFENDGSGLTVGIGVTYTVIEYYGHLIAIVEGGGAGNLQPGDFMFV
jgi:Ca2+-binding RTX toxin-like protein